MWANIDRPHERYRVEGLRITRTDARGTKHFAIQWDPRRQQWQWGAQGRLSLQWLGDDVIAWVPDMERDAEHAHTWRWQRCDRFQPPPPSESSYRPWRRSSSRPHVVEPYPGQPWRRPGETSSYRRSSSSQERHHHHRARHGGHPYHRGDHGGWRPQTDIRRLPCGLTTSEVNSLLFREITPEDYDLLCRLDETVSKPAGGANTTKDLPAAAPCDFLGGSCTVCLSAFEEQDEVAELPCGHHFHRECVTRWLAECRRTCPLCCSEALPSTAPAHGA